MGTIHDPGRTRVALFISQSRARRLAGCQLADWWAVEGARDGWQPMAPPTARAAHALKQTTSIPAVLGIALHEVFRQYTTALRDGRRPPSYDHCLSVVRGRLNVAAANRDIEAWLRDPRRPMLREVLVREWPDGRPPVGVATEVRVRAASMLRRLIGHALLRDLAACGRADIIACDALDAYLTTELVPDTLVRVYAAPDCVYIHRGRPLEPSEGGVPVPPGTPVIVDVKSKLGGRHEAARTQLQVYAWYATRRLGVRPGPTGVLLGRVVDLSAATTDEEDVMWVLSPADVEAGRAHLAQAVREIVALSDGSGRLQLDRVTRSEGPGCQWCPWSLLCVGRGQAPTALLELLAGDAVGDVATAVARDALGEVAGERP
jgi:hypothetical protein